MTNRAIPLALTFALVAPLALAAQEPLDRAAQGQAPRELPPDTAAPRDTPPPPPPPSARPKPPADLERERPRAEEGGQWVYTDQYGWVWMPYGEGFTHLPASGGTPHMYLYYPEVGWTWVLAPWLWGWGPRPYFGVLGPRYFGWWGVGLGRWYGFGPRYRTFGIGGHYWGSGHWVGVRPGGRGFAPGRGGGRSLAPGWRR